MSAPTLREALVGFLNAIDDLEDGGSAMPASGDRSEVPQDVRDVVTVACNAAYRSGRDGTRARDDAAAESEEALLAAIAQALSSARAEGMSAVDATVREAREKETALRVEVDRLYAELAKERERAERAEREWAKAEDEAKRLEAERNHWRQSRTLAIRAGEELKAQLTAAHHAQRGTLAIGRHRAGEHRQPVRNAHAGGSVMALAAAVCSAR